MPEAIPPEDERAVRWILAVPLVLLDALAAGCPAVALSVEGAGPWDDGAAAAVVLGAAAT